MRKLLILLLFPILSCTSSPKQEPKVITKYGEYFDTAISITLYGNYDISILDEAFTILADLQNKLSPYNKESELYKLNELAGTSPVTVSKELFDVITAALDISTKSQGVVDLTVFPLVKLWKITDDNPQIPKDEDIKEAKSLIDYHKVKLNKEAKTVFVEGQGMKIDLGFISKGYAADTVKDFLVQRGVKSAILNFGGNIYLIGKKFETDDFSVGLQNPTGQGYVMVIKSWDTSLVTSGVYERFFEVDGKKYHHILDVSTGYPKETDLLSVTIIGKSSTTDDALSTTFFLMGIEQGEAFLKEFYPDVTYIAITKDGKIHIQSGKTINYSNVMEGFSVNK